MSIRTITVFLGSSEELINDRNSFSDLIRALDDIYEPRGIRVKLKRCENFLAYCTGNRTQDDYNRILAACDISVCMFHRKAGKFTIEEFEKSIEAYQRTQSPKTYVYARVLVEGEVEEEELKQFKDELFKQMGHYWCNYATEDSMKLHFVMQFERLINANHGHREDNQNLSIEQGNVMLHGRKVADYNNIPFAANNTEVISLKEKIATLDKDIVALRSIGNDALTPMINEKLSERHQYQEHLEQLEKQLLDTALSISKMISSGHPISERKRAAIEMFEQGNNKGVLDMLNEEEIERDYQSAKNKLAAGKQLEEAAQKVIQAAQDEIRSLVEEYLLKSKTWMSTYSETNRFDEACKCYEQAIALTRESLTEEELAKRLFNYGKFLQDNNQYHQIETYYQEALEIYEQLATIFPETYEANVSNTFNNLANFYHCMHRFKEAEDCHLRALEIRERLAAKYPEAYEAMVAGTLNNLANLYCKTQRFVEAEKFYIRSLSIYEQLAANSPEIYEIDIARTLYNFAGTYLNIKRFAEAEEYLIRALTIQEKFARTKTETYESDLALTLNRLAILYYDTQRFSNVEKHFLGVLAIYERLAANYPKAYEWLLAQALTNLGELYCKMHRFSEVEECYFRSLAIFKRLATTYADVYGPSYVYTLNNVSEYSLQVQNYAQAEEYSREVLKWSDDINIYTNLAAAILLQGRFEEAKQIYLTYKDDLRDAFLNDFQTLKDNNAIPEHLYGDVEKIIKLLNS